MKAGFVAHPNKFLVIKLCMIAFISLRSQAATQKNLLLLCQSLEIMCKLRVRLHIFCGHGHIKMFTTCKAAPVTWWLNWPPFAMEGGGVRR